MLTIVKNRQHKNYIQGMKLFTSRIVSYLLKVINTHISEDGEVASYKGGAALIAYLSDTPIVPVYHLKRTNILRTTRMVVGKPFNVKEKIGPVLNQEKLNAVCEELRLYELELERICLEAMKK